MEVRAKQYWRRVKDGAELRVLGVAEGWVVARRKGCAPFLTYWRDFERDCVLLSVATA